MTKDTHRYYYDGYALTIRMILVDLKIFEYEKSIELFQD